MRGSKTLGGPGIHGNEASMSSSHTWFASDARLDARFTVADRLIPALEGFICQVSEMLAAGEELTSAVTIAAGDHPRAVDAFELRSGDFIEEDFALSDSITFATETLPEMLTFERASTHIGLPLDPFAAGDAREFLAMCGSGRTSLADARANLEPPLGALLETLLDQRLLVTGSTPPAQPLAPLVPGVTRLQHASLLFRGREAGVLVDPHLHSVYQPDGMQHTFIRPQFEGLVDAIVISHGHRDHWHLPTLLTFPPDTLIVVPRVPRASILSPDFERTLRAFGFTNVVSPAWYDPPLVVGDLEIHVLPFYGEQPLLNERPRHPDLRNHGNTYIIRHDSYLAWLLIDSGNDYAGRMADVALEVRRQYGPIDLLLSNLRPFPVMDPLYITGGQYWLALTPDQMRRFSTMSRDVITLGPDGVAEVCALAEAQRFLPYAHWWRDVGTHADAEERQLMERLDASVRLRKAATEVTQWSIGGTFLPVGASGRIIGPGEIPSA
jgi:L-ascorbate metabolism protein UlaG (beta-lactamase superfamily)